MNYYLKKIYIVIFSSVLSLSFVYAASITIDAPPQAASNRQPVVVRIFLDQENDSISGIGGNFSFPSDLFSVDGISTESSIVSLWVNQPAPSEEKYLDNRTHISFEGIFPGGYDGVRSPYYKGTRPGVLFSITLIPKNKGIGSFVVDDISLNAYDSKATPLTVESAIKTIAVPTLVVPLVLSHNDVKNIESPTLSAFVARDVLVNQNAWYLVVSEREQKSAISKIYVAETNDNNVLLGDDGRWHETKIPYTLFFQDRTKYIHVKVVYSNNTYATVTVQPVENSKSISYHSRILILVVFTLLLIYFYGKYYLIHFRKKI